MPIIHSKVSTLPDGPETDLVRPSDWNAAHVITPGLLHVHYVGEIPTKLTSRRFQTLNSYTAKTLAVYLNGLREKNIIEISGTEFEFTSDLSVDDEVLVDYIKIEV